MSDRRAAMQAEKDASHAPAALILGAGINGAALAREGNPFSTRFTRPGALPFHFDEGEDASHVVGQLRQHNWFGQIIGPHGSGKSTLLATLRPALVQVGWWLRRLHVVFCHLIDSSANNVVIECIVRNTPILINRLPAVEEYLGRGYPLFFSTLEEASAKLARRSNVLAAQEYLRGLPKECFSQKAFREGLLASDVYRGLAVTFSRPATVNRREATKETALAAKDAALVLSRAACGTLYVERMQFEAARAGVDGHAARDFEHLWCGLPLAAVRRLTLGDFVRCVSPNRTPQARFAYEVLHRALARV